MDYLIRHQDILLEMETMLAAMTVGICIDLYGDTMRELSSTNATKEARNWSESSGEMSGDWQEVS